MNFDLGKYELNPIAKNDTMHKNNIDLNLVFFDFCVAEQADKNKNATDSCVISTQNV